MIDLGLSIPAIALRETQTPGTPKLRGVYITEDSGNYLSEDGDVLLSELGRNLVTETTQAYITENARNTYVTENRS